MASTIRCLKAALAAGALALGLAAGASAQTAWPTSGSYSVGVSSDEAARIQVNANAGSPIGEHFSARLGGWWVMGEDTSRAFVGDAYLDFTQDPIYLAAGRKYLVLGPAGALVSPGVFGVEAQWRTPRMTAQALAGTLAFTPVTGGTRFTYAGSRSPADESIRAARVEVRVTDPTAEVPVTVGLNLLDVLEDTGRSADFAVQVADWLTLFGEAARYDKVDASVYGIRASDLARHPGGIHATSVVLYRRNIPIGYVPAAIGATHYFEGQTGWVAGVYHQLDARRGVGVYADQEDAIITLFGRRPL